MKTTQNIHGRINARANDANYAKLCGLTAPKEGRFYWSFDNNGNPRYAQLYRYERNGHHNDHTGFYN